MNILIADKFSQDGIDELESAGCKVTLDPGLAGDALRAAVAESNCTVLIVRGTRVSADAVSASAQLSLIVRAGAGYNTIDVAAASSRAVLVANCPGKNAVAVAELTFALILALDRRIVENVTDLRNGVWNKKEYTTARGLEGRTLGIIGMGKIGQAVARRGAAFDMHVVAWSRSLTDDRAEQLGVECCDSPADVADRSDVLSLHLAATPETKGLIGADVLNRLAPGSYVINTSRAEVLDHAALRAAIRERDIRVGLDVFEDEPAGGSGAFCDAIVRAGGVVYGTHHIGASTEQAQRAIAAEAVRIVTKYKSTGLVDNCVNLAPSDRAHYVLVVRHYNQPGVLAHVLGAISFARVNVEEMENIICAGAESACAQIKLDAPLADDVLEKIRKGDDRIIGVTFARLRE